MPSSSELSQHLREVRERIAAAEAAAHRDASSVALLAVSKTFGAQDVRAVFNAGQRAFGENYVQELVEKEDQLPKNIRWHFIGHLQGNKANTIVGIIIFGDS